MWNVALHQYVSGKDVSAVSKRWTELGLQNKDIYQVYEPEGSNEMFEVDYLVKNHLESDNSAVDDRITIESDNEEVCKPQAFYYERDEEDAYYKSNGRLCINLEALSDGTATITIKTSLIGLCFVSCFTSFFGGLIKSSIIFTSP